MPTSIDVRVEKGIKNLMRRSLSIWPGRCEQLLESSLSFYVGAEFLRTGFAVIQEFPVNSTNRVDLVAFERKSKTLVLLESKRFWSIHGPADPNALLRDIARIKRIATKGLSVWCSDGKRALSVKRAFGVALGSVSGRNPKATQKNLERAEKALNRKATGFLGDVHPDGTYAVLRRVWEIDLGEAR